MRDPQLERSLVVDADARLTQQCQALGSRACGFSGFIQRQANMQLEHCMTAEQWHHYGAVAAFLAFAELGGSVDTPEDFDWSSKELFRRAVSHLQTITLGSQSDVYDRIMRTRSRLTGSQVKELQWDAWGSVAVEDLKQVQSNLEASQSQDGLSLYPRDAAEHYYDFEQQTDFELNETELTLELARHLKPQEVVWLIRRYRDGETTATLAQEFVKKDVRYQTEDGLTRAIRYIDVAIHRAKKKAQKLLTPRWHHLAAEVA